MAANHSTRQRIAGYCALCVSRCGSIAIVEGGVEGGRFVALEPDPSHPTGQALCAKGRAAPELVYHPDRLLYPLKRTRPKGDADPGWQRITWEEAMSLTASKLRQLAAESGPESVVFSMASPSTSASSDAMAWIERMADAFGTPNKCISMELCGWGRYLAPVYSYGTSVPGAYMPDLENAGCILFWGYNPNIARLSHAVATTAALRRGARLIVVDPRRTGPAARADVWLQVRPGTDAALALAIAHVMIEQGWYDRDFVRDWTNAPLLVRMDNGRLLRASDLTSEGSDQDYVAQVYVAWNEQTASPMLYDAQRRHYEGSSDDLALFAEVEVNTAQGKVPCRTVFALTAEECRRYAPERAEEITGVPPEAIIEAARLLWAARPVAYYTWSGIEQQTNATQIALAIALVYALTGSFDSKGGNVLFAGVPSARVDSVDSPHNERQAPALGLAERPLGPSRWNYVSTEEIYRGILAQQPYAVRGMVGFGANILVSHADGRRGREALAALDFYVHADLFMNPTAEMADIVLPVASAFEREGLKIGFEVSADAQRLVQLRQPVVAARGESRSDVEIVFDLACRLGLGEHFWHGDIDAAYRHQLAPSGLSLEELRRETHGVRLPLQTHYRKFAVEEDGVAKGFATPTGKIEFYSETLLAHGYSPLPDFQEPLVSPRSRPDLAERYPLIFTCTKHNLFCESQMRGLPSLRRLALDPEIEVHPLAAAARGIAAGEWVEIESPLGSVRARARLNKSLSPDVVCGQHGWWQRCDEIGAPGYDPFGSDGANLNIIIGGDAIDPFSGSVPHRAYLCEIRRLEEDRIEADTTHTAAASSR